MDFYQKENKYAKRNLFVSFVVNNGGNKHRIVRWYGGILIIY